MTLFIEPTGSAWMRDVNKRLAQLERIPRVSGTVSATTDLSATNVTFEADALSSIAGGSDPSFMSTPESVLPGDPLDVDPEAQPLDPYMHEEYSDIPTDARTGLLYTPPAPSDPVIENRSAGIAVIWNGSGAGGEALPVNMLLVEIHRAQNPAFDPSEATYCGSFLDAGIVTFTDQTFEVEWYYRLVLLTTDGRHSTPSNSVLAVAHRIQTGDVGFSALDIDSDRAIDWAAAAGLTRRNHATNPRMVGPLSEWVGVIVLDSQFDSVEFTGRPGDTLYSGVDGGAPGSTFDSTLDGGHP